MLQFLRTNINHPKFKSLVQKLDEELNGMYGNQMEFFGPHNILEDDTYALVLLESEEPIGIGAYKKTNEIGEVEIKRMFVSQTHRGRGLSKVILEELENWASEEKFTYSKLETGDKNVAAISLYLKTGYELIDNFEPYIGVENSFCYGKNLN